MRKLARMISVAGLVLTTAAGCSTYDSGRSGVASYGTDASITTQVKSRFVRDPGVSAMHLGVTTTDGVVELTGKAASVEEERRAVELARAVPGVRSVRDYIVVQPGMPQ